MANPRDFEFTAVERELICSALVLKSASIQRAIKAESNPAVAKLRQADLRLCDELASRFVM